MGTNSQRFIDPFIRSLFHISSTGDVERTHSIYLEHSLMTEIWSGRGIPRILSIGRDYPPLVQNTRKQIFSKNGQRACFHKFHDARSPSNILFPHLHFRSWIQFIKEARKGDREVFNQLIRNRSMPGRRNRTFRSFSLEITPWMRKFDDTLPSSLPGRESSGARGCL